MQVEKCQFFIPGGNAATLLDPVEETFNMIALAVMKRAEADWASWDYRAAVHYLIQIGFIRFHSVPVSALA